MNDASLKSCDVLVAGSGLAGLAAGVSALERCPGLDVCVACQRPGPSGSSFTNRNDSLGMVVCRDGAERVAFVNAALSLAGPGTLREPLVRIMARASETCFLNLAETGFRFRADGSENLLRVPCCFLREPPLAFVFDHLRSAFDAMKRRFLSAGGTLVSGICLKDLVRDNQGNIQGALFEESETGRHLAVRSKATVLATGGAAGLFHRHLSAGENLGFATALMAGCGVPLVNMPFVQFLWVDTKTLEHWPCWDLARPGVRVGPSDIQPPPEIKALCDQRSRHVPMAHGLEDSALDRFLLSVRNPDGTVSIWSPEKGRFTVAAYAHAMNGGAAIDEDGRTSLEGLFACGECAGGMHGANRVGGAMVLATQVFGSRAGVAAAEFAAQRPRSSGRGFSLTIQDRLAGFQRDDREWNAGLSAVRQVLDTIAGPWPSPVLAEADRKLARLRETARDWRLKLALEAARTITGAFIKPVLTV